MTSQEAFLQLTSFIHISFERSIDGFIKRISMGKQLFCILFLCRILHIWRVRIYLIVELKVCAKFKCFDCEHQCHPKRHLLTYGKHQHNLLLQAEKLASQFPDICIYLGKNLAPGKGIIKVNK